MKVESIKRGNAFYLDYTITCKNSECVEQPILIADIDNLKVGVSRGAGSYIQITPSFIDNVITLHITEEQQPAAGVYRLILTGTYQGEAISINPEVYRLVNNTEEESRGSRPCAGVRRVAITGTLGIWKGVYGSIINVVDELPEVGVPGQFYAIPE